MLTDNGIKSKQNIQKDNYNSVPPPSTIIDVVPKISPPKENCWILYKNWMRNLLMYESIDCMEKRRATLGLVATVISTMSFQVAINPPGGVYQELLKNGRNKNVYAQQMKLEETVVHSVLGKQC